MTEEFILGINGWEVRGHDASASLIRCSSQGIEVIAAAEEERFTREKHAYDCLPHQAANFCLEEGEINVEDLSAVAFSWDMPKRYLERKIDFDITDKGLIEFLFRKKPKKYPQLNFIDHHSAHALSTYSPSHFDEATILVIDGQGETDSLTVWEANKNKLYLSSRSQINSSLGYFYEALSEFVGFAANQAGKTMGLAPYGNSERFLEELMDFFVVDGPVLDVPEIKLELGKSMGKYLPLDEQEQTRGFWLNFFSSLVGVGPAEKSQNYNFRDFPEPYLSLAASGQKVLEELVLKIAKENRGGGKICLAGGVALNCVANGKLIQEGFDIYVQPAANDAGTSLGAALEIARQKGYPITNVSMSPYLGKSYSDGEVKQVLDSEGVKYNEEEDLSETIAEHVTRGEVIGLFQGRFEFGPRALGNRSFIADPSNAKMLDYINNHIKSREEGRPLGPSLLLSETDKFFEGGVRGPHMTIVYPVKGNMSAITHIDGTTRPQILTREDNPVYHQQLEEIKKKTGTGAVINTSLNFKEPIIASPYEALSLLKRTAVDHIAFNNKFIIRR